MKNLLLASKFKIKTRFILLFLFFFFNSSNKDQRERERSLRETRKRRDISGSGQFIKVWMLFGK